MKTAEKLKKIKKNLKIGEIKGFVYGGEEFFVKMLTAGDMLDVRQSLSSFGDNVPEKILQQRIAVKAFVEEDGQRVFTDDQESEILDMPADFLSTIVLKATQCDELPLSKNTENTT